MRSAASSARPATTERLGVLNAHPDLAGKLAAAKRLTPESTQEQASAGLDALTDEERELFSKLNAAYVTTFGFPFIIAVQGQDQGRDPGRLRNADRQRPRDRVRHRLPRGRAHRAAAPERPAACLKEHEAWLADTYYAPPGGLPPQTQLLTGRAVFTEAYAVIPKGVMQRHRHQPAAVLGTTRAAGSCRARCRASPRRFRNTSWKSRPAAAATGRSRTRARKACCSSSRAS